MYCIAHRGNSDKHKDNTLESFLSALEYKFDMIELDIQLTKDNKIIVYHDTYINDSLIKDMNYSDIIKLDKDIMSIQHFFEKIDYTKISIYLDIKGDHYISSYLHKFLRNMDISKILIGSFNFITLETLYNLNNSYNLGLITENNMNNEILQYYIDKLDIAFVSYHWSVLDNRSINYLQNRNILVFTYTCKDKNIENFINKYRIDGVVSNYKF